MIATGNHNDSMIRCAEHHWRGNPFSYVGKYGLPHHLSGLVRNDILNLVALGLAPADPFAVFALLYKPFNLQYRSAES